MECGRLNRLIRSWYEQVQDESMAPARMVEFMESHILDCDICLADPYVRHETEKISEIVLPSSKMTKAARKEASAKVEEEDNEPVEEEAENGLSEEYEEEDDDLDPVFMEEDADKLA